MRWTWLCRKLWVFVLLLGTVVVIHWTLSSSVPPSIGQLSIKSGAIAMANDFEIASNVHDDNKRYNTVSWRPPCTKPRLHLAYIKTHKCASDMLAAVFRRLAYVRNISLVIPRKGHQSFGWPYPLYPGRYRVTKTGEYNILADHTVYDENLFKLIMPPEAIYTSSLRQPFDRMKSAFRYWNMIKLMKLGKFEDPLSEYMSNLDYYDARYKKLIYTDVEGRMCIPTNLSMTKNGMAFDLGFPTGFLPGTMDQSNNRTFIDQWVDGIAKRFPLIIIIEYLDESLILLKRLMCWDFADIMHRFMNSRASLFTFKESYDPDLMDKYKQWSQVDYILYDRFNRTLWEHIEEEDDDFWDEVSQFRHVQKNMTSFCDKQIKGEITIEASQWNERIVINNNNNDCYWLANPHKDRLIKRYEANPTEVIEWNMEGPGC